jgi:hypothetical protein
MRLKAAKDKAKAKAESSEASNGKRKAEPVEETSGKKKKASKTELPKIGEHESLGEYNRRIEGLLRGGVAKAIKAAEGVRGQQVQAAKDAKAERIAIAQGKKAAKGDADSDDETDAADAKYNSDGQLKPNRPERTFAELPQRKRLNDIVQAPPQLPRLKAAEKAKKKAGDGNDAWGATGRTPLSAAQKRILDTERERVVNLYREMKAKKEADKEAAKSKSK